MMGKVVLLLALASSGVAAGASAQAKGSPKVIELEEIRIEGRVQKPNAFYILNRAALSYELERSDRRFFSELMESAFEEPVHAAATQGASR